MSFVYALGLFDSVHIAHRALIKDGKDLASSLNADFAVVTFPDEFYANLGLKRKEVYLLEERLTIFKELNVGAYILPSDKNFLKKTGIEFLRYISDLHPAGLILGSDYTFGNGAEGNAEFLKAYFSPMNVKVKILDLITYNSVKIATSKIAKLIKTGDIEAANRLLGGNFFLTGKVVSGSHYGRTFGVPTANIEVDKNKILPAEGVYSTRSLVDGRSFLSVTNVGPQPTLGGDTTRTETHLIDFDGDIYGKKIKVVFNSYLREVKKFSNVAALRERIASDIEIVKRSMAWSK